MLFCEVALTLTEFGRRTSVLVRFTISPKKERNLEHICIYVQYAYMHLDVNPCFVSVYSVRNKEKASLLSMPVYLGVWMEYVSPS